MALAPLEAVRKTFDRVRDAAGGDGELLTRYRQQRDQEAFGSLVRRHGPMVLGVCRRVLRDSHAADDAFQATFLVLAKKADRVRPPDRLAPWLYGVATRTAMKARGREVRRQQVERAYAIEAQNRAPAADEPDLLPVIDEQLNALPEKYRTPLVLCALQGLNKTEVAERLGLPEGTVSSRLARAREMLRDRLTRRGMVVPAAALGTLLTADALHAAVPPALAASAAEVATGTALVSPTVLALTHEVLRSMTLLKLKALCAVATVVALTGGGFGLYAIPADDKKPAGAKPAVKPDGEKPKPAAKPDGEKPKPANPDGDKPKPAPDGEKKPGKVGGRVAGVDTKEHAIMIAFKGDNGIVEKLFPVAKDAKVFIDGKDAKLADVPKNSTAALVLAPGKEGVQPTATEVHITGSTVSGIIKQADTTTIVLESEKKPQSFAITAGTQVTVNGKAAKPADLKAGDKVVITLTANEKSVLTVAGGTKPGDGEKPKPAPDGEKKPGKFGGKVASLDPATRTVTVTIKSEGGGKEVVVKLTTDAKIVVDGKEAKFDAIQKGAFATFALVAAKDGQPREATEVTVAGATFTGVIKQIDTAAVTLGTEKAERVVKLAPGAKVLIGEKEGKLADLKVGDKVTVTLTADESAATQIQTGTKKPGGDKPKPDKDEDGDQ